MKTFISVISAIVLLEMASCTTAPEPGGPADSPVMRDAKAFISEYEAKVKPLEIALSLAWWDANTTGKDEAFQAKTEAQDRFDAAFADPQRFALLKKIREELKAGPGKPDAAVSREIDLLYLQYLERQVDPEILKKISAKENAIEQAFNVYRPKVEGKEMADSEVRKVLRESKDSKYRKAVWEAQKGVGAVVEKDLRELVGLRNEAARKLGFKDYHVMRLELAEQDQSKVLRLFDELDGLIREPFQEAKAEFDRKLAKDYGIAEGELRPWHYQDPFFQEAPLVSGADLDPIYGKADMLKLCREFYAGIGLPVESVLARSDLYEKKGKSPHAFSTDIDREGDVRVLANIVPSELWMGTMLHELGHSVYTSLNIPSSVPYILRMEAHPIATEGIAMMFEKFAMSAEWMAEMGLGVPNREALSWATARMRRHQLLVFAAWSQVMFRFEVGMYGNPDQDLSKLWWDLVERYQLVRRPDGRSAPDYAAKLHIVAAPCYYHNYLMGQLFASQVHRTICREVLKADPEKALYNGNRAVGEFLKGKVFAPGRSLTWNDLTRSATGEDLNPKAFAADLKMR